MGGYDRIEGVDSLFFSNIFKEEEIWQFYTQKWEAAPRTSKKEEVNTDLQSKREGKKELMH